MPALVRKQPKIRIMHAGLDSGQWYYRLDVFDTLQSSVHNHKYAISHCMQDKLG